jgi:hypothetical protein
LIILPSAHTLTQSAWEKLIKAVEAGATMLVTGPIDWDEYWRPVDRLGQYGIEAETRPVAREEETIVYGAEFRLTFSDEKVNRMDKAVVGGQSGQIKVQNIGGGKLIFAPLPFELADNLDPTAALYQFALKQAGIERPFNVDRQDPCLTIRPQVFEKSVFYTIVSETDTDKQFELTDGLTHKTLTVKVPAQRSIMFLLSRPDGRVLAQYGDGVAKE